ncbi:hypothetical protein AAEX37_01994 [Oligella sp. MSHR50489EDL]|uniref:hypothetical protein n=1 Tax=Oligella sp. MSHR50489EDL TaxID=3139409 RepID=UPI003D815FBA
MNHYELDFESWYEIICAIAEKHDVDVSDKEPWLEAYDEGLYPETAFYNECPEYEVDRDDI